jgi:peptidoglycan/xylan/chitin deacetylase (PgdA/CDA1 family)
MLILQSVVRAQPHTVAMTVDDLPFASGLPSPLSSGEAKKAMQVNETILRAFSHHHVPAMGFVIGRHAEQLGLTVSKEILRQWIRPGFDLGNHLYSHPDVNDLSVEQAEREITSGEAIFAPLLKSVSRTPQFLRFPFNHTGDTKEKRDAIAAFMSTRGYRLAPCTIDNSDYDFNKTYALALARHDDQAAAKVRVDYIAYTEAEIDWYTALNKQIFGYEPPHIMLLHDSPLNADTIEKMLLLFTKRGYTFITLEEAEKDPAYAVPDTYVTKFGPMWGYRWAQELHVKVNGRGEPEPPAWIDQYAKNHSPDH